MKRLIRQIPWFWILGFIAAAVLVRVFVINKEDAAATPNTSANKGGPS